MNDISSTPIARSSDPISSHLAAEEMTNSGKRGAQQRISADTVKRFPGHTSLELSKLCGLDRYQLARRLSEIENLSVEKGPLRCCKISGRKAMTWYPIRKDDTGKRNDRF